MSLLDFLPRTWDALTHDLSRSGRWYAWQADWPALAEINEPAVLPERSNDRVGHALLNLAHEDRGDDAVAAEVMCHLARPLAINAAQRWSKSWREHDLGSIDATTMAHLWSIVRTGTAVSSPKPFATVKWALYSALRAEVIGPRTCRDVLDHTVVSIDGVAGLLDLIPEPGAPVDRADLDLERLLSWARQIEGLSPEQAELLEDLVLVAVSEEMAERPAHQEANILARRRGVSPSTIRRQRGIALARLRDATIDHGLDLADLTATMPATWPASSGPAMCRASA